MIGVAALDSGRSAASSRPPKPRGQLRIVYDADPCHYISLTLNAEWLCPLDKAILEHLNREDTWTLAESPHHILQQGGEGLAAITTKKIRVVVYVRRRFLSAVGVSWVRVLLKAFVALSNLGKAHVQSIRR